ncbi:hypothetical protein D3C87_1210500 [compost metagenome]
MARGKGGRGALQHFAHGIELADFLLIHGGHDQAPAGLVRDQPFVLDALERFAHWRAPHLEHVGDFHFAQAVAGREHPGKDAALDFVIGRVGLRIALRDGHGCLVVFLYIFAYKKIQGNKAASKWGWPALTRPMRRAPRAAGSSPPWLRLRATAGFPAAS